MINNNNKTGFVGVSFSGLWLDWARQVLEFREAQRLGGSCSHLPLFMTRHHPERDCSGKNLLTHMFLCSAYNTVPTNSSISGGLAGQRLGNVRL